MIVSRVDDRWRCITQPDHARASADILSLWRSAPLPDHPRREMLLRAVRDHDNGWRETDAAPRLDPRRECPLDFKSQPLADRFEIWERGIARYRDQPYLAALIVEHARVLHLAERSSDAWSDFLGRLDSLKDELLATAGIDSSEIDHDYPWLHLADLLSLGVCDGWTQPFERGDFRGHFDSSTVWLEPFPLAGVTTFEIPCRMLPKRVYANDVDLATELARARWQTFRFKLAPAD